MYIRREIGSLALIGAPSKVYQLQLIADSIWIEVNSHNTANEEEVCLVWIEVHFFQETVLKEQNPPPYGSMLTLCPESKSHPEQKLLIAAQSILCIDTNAKNCNVEKLIIFSIHNLTNHLFHFISLPVWVFHKLPFFLSTFIKYSWSVAHCWTGCVITWLQMKFVMYSSTPLAKLVEIGWSKFSNHLLFTFIWLCDYRDVCVYYSRGFKNKTWSGQFCLISS